MNILLTGGAGYIGSHAALVLKKAGFVPIVLDNLVNGHKWAVKYGPFVQADISDENAVDSLCREYKPAAVIHFAAFIEVAESVINPARYMENNFQKAAKLFDTLHACGVNKVVFSSTAAVYGITHNNVPISESHPLNPINPYGESKLAAETYLRSMDQRGIRSITLRYFNAGGAAPASEGIGEAHYPETHLIPNVIVASLNPGKTLSLYGVDHSTPDGTAVRDYNHVMDLAEAHVAALRYLLDGGASEIFNVGTGRGASVKEVISAVEQISGRKIPYKIKPRRAGDPSYLIADASRTREKLGWKPKENLDSIIKSAFVWHESGIYRHFIAERQEKDSSEQQS